LPIESFFEDLTAHKKKLNEAIKHLKLIDLPVMQSSGAMK
jgi:hypothetical protein